jgi:hypothetical protein
MELCRIYYIAVREWLSGVDWSDAVVYAKNVVKDLWL